MGRFSAVLLAAIDTSQILDDFQDFVADNPLPVYAGATILILLLVGSLYRARSRRGDDTDSSGRPKGSRKDRRQAKKEQKKAKK